MYANNSTTRNIVRTSKLEVQEFDGGFAGFLATYEIDKKTGEKEIVNCQRLTKPFGDPRPAMIDLQTKFADFQKRQ